MNEPRLMLLATATARFEAIDHPAKAMFEMFRIHDLRPLNDDECNTIWKLVTGAPLPGLQIRPIRILTGGNARLIALVARFGKQRSFRELLENLIDLIDEHTDYFKSQLDNMAPMERKVYLALAELWKQSSAKEIAEVARLDVNTTSAFLKRLASRGKVTVENEGKRKKWYSISEGIYNIYYLMRRRGGPSARVKAAVRFMVGLYEPVVAAKLLIDESCKLDPQQCRDHIIALAEVYVIAKESQRYQIAQSVPLSVLESPYLETRIRDELKVLQDSGKGVFVANNEISKKIQTQIDTAKKNYNEGMHEVALEKLQRVVDEYSDRKDSWLTFWVLLAMIYKGRFLGELSRLDDAINVFEEIERKYKDELTWPIAPTIAWGMTRKGSLLTEACRFEEAIEVCERVVQRYANCNEKEMATQIAWAMFFKGLALSEIARFEEAIIAYDGVLETYSNCKEAQIVEINVMAVIERDKVLLRMGRNNDVLFDIKRLMNNSSLSGLPIEELIKIHIDLAASGDSEALLNILAESPAAQQLEPLIAGLQLYCGQEVRTAPEILEVAKDVVARIEARKREFDALKK